MDQDWSALGRAIEDRLTERGMTMTDLANKSGVSLTTVRELVHVLNTRKRNPRTLVALSESLGWPADYLTKVLRGGAAGSSPATPDTIAQLQEELSGLHSALADLNARVARLETAQTIDGR